MIESCVAHQNILEYFTYSITPKRLSYNHCTMTAPQTQHINGAGHTIKSMKQLKKNKMKEEEEEGEGVLEKESTNDEFLVDLRF